MNIRDQHKELTGNDFLCKEDGNAYCEYLEKIVQQERQAKAELLEALKNLLYDDAMPYYSLFPNSHRQTKEEYFKAEIDLISKHETKEEV